jgi:hypothetical protein
MSLSLISSTIFVPSKFQNNSKFQFLLGYNDPSLHSNYFTTHTLVYHYLFTIEQQCLLTTFKLFEFFQCVFNFDVLGIEKILKIK